MVNNNKDSAAVRISPPAIPVLIILIGVGLHFFWPIDLGFEIAKPMSHWLGGATVALALVGLGGWSVFLMGRDGQSENPWKPMFKIIDRGPFRVTRNPMYLQGSRGQRNTVRAVDSNIRKRSPSKLTAFSFYARSY
jgi:protein-S-isoprenylcysteine O-methyltransferase Ste14